MRTFKCNFGNGVSCEVKVPDKFDEHLKSHILSCEWDGKMTEKHLRPYIGWMNSVNRQLADEWNTRLMHCYQIERNVWEMWVFLPGKPPLMAERQAF